MRFAELSLDRYGLFEGCNLAFGSADPDFHVIFAPNEGGKSTTIAAVSDLLFGFPPRSPYNFRFDYPLLRVGAVLEEGTQRFSCRRRKAPSASLIDASERSIDDAPLLAMLRGQTRESFQLGFSLDQAQLRSGGQAMIDSRSDLGRTLFAAGSGLTGISAILDALEAEADQIWGKRESARRTYTIASRQYADAQRRVREAQLRPRDWQEAKSAVDRHGHALRALEEKRDALVAEQRRIDRLRRIGPAMRRRDELQAAIAGRSGTIALQAAEEEAAEGLIAEIAAAERTIGTNRPLRQELEQRLTQLRTDAAMIEAADRLEALAGQLGGVEKGERERASLEAELRSLGNSIAALRAEIGQSGDHMPTRIVVAQLRQIASGRAEVETRLRTFEERASDLGGTAETVRKRLAEAVSGPEREALAVAVDRARALGDNIDERCASLAADLEIARTKAASALSRLAPWAGTVEALRQQVTLSAEELDRAIQDVARWLEDQRSARDELSRVDAELRATSARLEALASSGDAVPRSALEDARGARDDRWAGIKARLIAGEAVPDPEQEALAFESLVGDADALADRRFENADQSARLAVIEEQEADLRVAAELARTSVERIETVGASTEQAWHDRLGALGLPLLEPLRLRTWLADRDEALSLADAMSLADAALAREQATRKGAAAALEEALGRAPAANLLAPVLAAARLRLKALDDIERQRVNDRDELGRLESELASACQRIQALGAERDAFLSQWRAAVGGLGVGVPIEAAEAVLSAFEQLRELRDSQADLQRRLEQTREDAARFNQEVTALGAALGAKGETASQIISSLRRRLDDARGAAALETELRQTLSLRDSEIETAEAMKASALEGLASIMQRLGAVDIEALQQGLTQSRELRELGAELADRERDIVLAGDGYSLADLEQAWSSQPDPEAVAARAGELERDLGELNPLLIAEADALGEARTRFSALEETEGASGAAEEAEQARAEMDAQAETYLLKRAEASMLRWIVERYRERRQDPLLSRASALFECLTLGRYSELRVDYDAATPRLLGICEGGQAAVYVENMSEGTTDQLYLALRLSAVEHTISASVRLPFLADDLFVNFDDARARAGFEVLAELARSTQVLFFTHHEHLVRIARSVIGESEISTCSLA